MDEAVLDSIRRDGVTLRFEDRGHGAPPLVFVHGWGCNHLHFAPQARHFAAQHRVVVPDQRGHGRSDAPHEPIGIDLLADDLAWLCGALSLERPILVGHSLGGAVALAASARLPEIAGLALVDPALFYDEPTSALLNDLVERLTLASWRETVRRFASGAFFRPEDPADHGELIEALLATPRRVLHPTLRDLLAFDPDPALERLDAPLLVIDPPRPAGDRARLRAALPSLEARTVEDVGHFVQLEAPGRVNAALAGFVARCT